MSADAVQSASPVQVTMAQLLSLSHPASGMDLDALRVRAPQHGARLSPLRGRGMEFDETRPYQDGDDTRSIDWRVTARTGRTHTKLFREERERPVLIGVDVRASMFFASRGAFKAVRAAQAAALLAWAASQQGDRVGGLVLAGDTHRELRPVRGRRGVLRLFDALLTLPRWDGTGPSAEAGAGSLQTLVARLRHVARPGTRVFLISDFIDLTDAEVPALRELARHGDLLTLAVQDALDRELPPPGLYPVLRNGQRTLLDSADEALRQRHRERHELREAALAQLARAPGVYGLQLDTADDAVEWLRRRFARRRGRQ